MEYDRLNYETVTLSGTLKYKGTPVLSYKIDYPRFQSPYFRNAVRRMNQFYYSRAKTWEKYYKLKLYPLAAEQYNDSVKNGFPVREFDVVTAFQVTYNQDCTVSLYTDRYEYTGGAHGNTVRISETWNLLDGERMRLGEFFSLPLDVREYAVKFIDAQIESKLAGEEGYYFENYKENVLNAFRAENFYLAPVGIIIYFQQYDIAPYSSGIPQFLIPFSYGVVLHPEC